MKKTKMFLALLLAAVMCVSLLAACGGDDSAESTAPTGSGNGDEQQSGPFTYPMSGGHSITYWCTFNELMSHSYTDMNESPFGKGLH